jgi:hypothetical protein
VNYNMERGVDIDFRQLRCWSSRIKLTIESVLANCLCRGVSSGWSGWATTNPKSAYRTTGTLTPRKNLTRTVSFILNVETISYYIYILM